MYMNIDVRTLSALYATVIGFTMLSMWTVFALTNQIPELHTGSKEIIYHLIAEGLTSIILILAGIGLFKSKKWSFHLFLVSLGMLFYTTIVSAGYYVDAGELSMMIMFSFLQVITFLFIVLSICKYDLIENNIK